MCTLYRVESVSLSLRCTFAKRESLVKSSQERERERDVGKTQKPKEEEEEDHKEEDIKKIFQHEKRFFLYLKTEVRIIGEKKSALVYHGNVVYVVDIAGRVLLL